MGFMTDLSICNDAWHRLKQMILEEPQTFVDEIQMLINGRPMYDNDRYLGSKESDEIRIPSMIGYSTVYRSHHADDPRLYLSFQNSFQALDQFSFDRELQMDPYNRETLLLDHFERDLDVAERMLKNAREYIAEHKKALV